MDVNLVNDRERFIDVEKNFTRRKDQVKTSEGALFLDIVKKDEVNF